MKFDCLTITHCEHNLIEIDGISNYGMTIHTGNNTNDAELSDDDKTKFTTCGMLYEFTLFLMRKVLQLIHNSNPQHNPSNSQTKDFLMSGLHPISLQ